MTKITLDIEEIGIEIAENLEDKEDLIWADVCDKINEYLADIHNAIAEIIDLEFEEKGVKYEY